MKRKIFFLGIILFWCFFLLGVFNNSLPIPKSNSFEFKATIFSFLPQGWGFFTRNPREESISLIKKKSDKLIDELGVNGKFNNFWGASRKNRFRNIEFSIIKNNINDSSWVNGDIDKFNLDDNIKTDTIVNLTNPKTILGNFFIVKQERVPWAWARMENVVMPYKYVKIYVK